MLYAHSARIKTRQILTDLALLVWIIAWAWVGNFVYTLINKLRGPTESIANAAASLSSGINDAQSGLPGFLRDRTNGASTPTDAMRDAAASQADAITNVASVMGWSVALVPIVVGVAIAAYFRVRWMLRVRGATQLAANPRWMELLANRAVMRQPLQELSKVSNDPLGDLVAGNHRALAQLELAELGIDPAVVDARARSRRRRKTIGD